MVEEDGLHKETIKELINFSVKIIIEGTIPHTKVTNNKLSTDITSLLMQNLRPYKADYSFSIFSYCCETGGISHRWGSKALKGLKDHSFVEEVIIQNFTVYVFVFAKERELLIPKEIAFSSYDHIIKEKIDSICESYLGELGYYSHKSSLTLFNKIMGDVKESLIWKLKNQAFGIFGIIMENAEIFRSCGRLCWGNAGIDGIIINNYACKGYKVIIAIPIYQYK